MTTQWIAHIISFPIALAFSFLPATGPVIVAPVIELEPSRDELDPLFILNYYARQYKVDFALGETLMWYESRFCQNEKNPKSSAKGCYQFLDSTWKSLCEGDVYNYRDNISCAMRLIGKGGLSHWTADKNIEWLLKNKGFIE